MMAHFALLLCSLFLAAPAHAERAVMERSTMSAGSFIVFPDLTKQYTAATGSGGGGDNLGSHIATMTVSAPYGISASTLALSGDLNTSGSIFINTNAIPSLNLVGWGPTIELYNTFGTGNVWYLHTAKTSLKDFAIVGGTTAAMTFIPDAWNVGILNTSPKYRLDVVGGGNFTSSMTVGAGYYGDGANLTGVLHSYTETDPIFSASTAFGIGPSDISNWNGKVNRAGDTMTGPLTINGSSITASGLVLNTGTNSTTIKSTNSSTALNIVLPPDSGTNGYRLTTDGAGNTTWQPPASSISSEYFLSPYSSDVSPYLLMLASATVGIPASTRTVTVSGTVIISTYITPLGFPNVTTIPDGAWETHIWAAKTGGTKDLTVTASVYKRASGGTETLLFTFPPIIILGATPTQYTANSSQNAISILSTDRIVIKYSATSSGVGSNPTLKAYRDNNYYSDLDIPQPIANVGTYIPYTGAVADVDLGAHKLTVSSNVFIVGYSSATKYYGDGSSLTGLAGGGDVVKAATQTLTGINTFTNSVSMTATGSTGVQVSSLTVGALQITGVADIGITISSHSIASGTSGVAACPSGRRVVSCGTYDMGMASTGNTLCQTADTTTGTKNFICLTSGSGGTACGGATGIADNYAVFAYCARIK